VLTLLLLLAHELVVMPRVISTAKPYFDNYELPMWDVHQEALDRGTATADVLFLGDSVFLGGIDSRAFEQSTGVRAYNLSLAGMQPPGLYVMLQRYLSTHDAPSVVVLNPSPPFLSDNAITRQYFNTHFIRWCIRAGEMARLAGDLGRWRSNAPAIVGEYLQSAFSPTLTYRIELAELAHCWLRNDLSHTQQMNADIRATMEQQRGFRVWREFTFLGGTLNRAVLERLRERPGVQGSLRRTYHDMLFVFHPIPLHQQYLDRVLALCQEHDIQVLMYMGPFPETLHILREATGYNTRIRAYAAAILDRHPHVNVLDPLLVTFDDDLFQEPFHLTSDGADALTAMMASWYQSQPTLQQADRQ